jgi:hypothetical protein
MPTLTPPRVLSNARAALESTLEFPAFLDKLARKDRLAAEKHVATCEAEIKPNHANLWKRLVCSLATLAPHATKVNGGRSVQFYVPDGKYKMQVFAVGDSGKGTVEVFCGNTLQQAIKAGVLKAVGEGEEVRYAIVGTNEVLQIDEMDGKTENVADYYKHMLGWDRRALRITLPVGASDAQISATEDLCALSALAWVEKA